MILGMRMNATLFGILAFIFVMYGVSPTFGAEPTKILILPFHLPPDSTNQELQTFRDHVNKTLRANISRMGDNFRVETESATDRALKDGRLPETDDEAQAIGAKAGSDLVVYGFLSADGSKYQMRGAMWNVRSGRMIVSIDLKVSNIHELPGVLQLFVNTINNRLQARPALPFYKAEPPYPGGPNPPRLPTPVQLPRNTGPWRSPEVGSALLAVDIGDLDGDRKNETVFVEERGVTISRFENGSLRPLTQFSEPPAVYLSAEVEDIDGDGIAELLLCYQTLAGLESSVIKYTNRKLVVVGRFPNVILRTVKEPGEDNRILVGQRVDTDDVFSGEMIRFHVEHGQIKPSGTIMLPPGTLLLSYAGGHLGKSDRFLQVILNQDQRLMVFDQENRLLANLTDRLYGSDKKVRLLLKSGPKDIVLPGTILIADTKGDGDNELLVIKQSDGNSFVQALGWDGHQLVDKWKTIRSSGIISDFRIRDFKNEGIKSLVLLLVKHQFLPLAPRSVVFAYDLIP